MTSSAPIPDPAGILACPWCGGPPNIERYVDEHGLADGSLVIVRSRVSCCAETCAAVGPWAKSEDAAIADWNKVARLDAKLWLCDACGFGFDEKHRYADGTIDCPVCAESNTSKKLTSLRGRVADLTILLGHGLNTPDDCPFMAHAPDGKCVLFFYDSCGDEIDTMIVEVEPDTGFPILTDAARLALKGGSR